MKLVNKSRIRFVKVQANIITHIHNTHKHAHTHMHAHVRYKKKLIFELDLIDYVIIVDLVVIY